MKYMVSKLKFGSQRGLHGEGEVQIWLPNGLRSRWQRQMGTPYAELPESEKESDRVEADKMIAKLAENVVKVLNEALEADPSSIKKMFKQQFCTTKKIATHPTIQVGQAGGVSTVSVLGLINGIIGVRPDGWGYVTGVFDDETNEVVSFELTKRGE